MNYPTPQEVEQADHVQLATWHRFLKSPGMEAIGQPNYEEVLNAQVDVLARIEKRLVEKGGFTPQISKQIGWTQQ